MQPKQVMAIKPKAWICSSITAETHTASEDVVHTTLSFQSGGNYDFLKEILSVMPVVNPYLYQDGNRGFLKLVFRDNSFLPCWVRTLTDWYFISEMGIFFWIFTKITSNFSETLKIHKLVMITVLQSEWCNTHMNNSFLLGSSLCNYWQSE